MKISTLLMLCIILLLGLIAYSLGVRVHVDVKQKPTVVEHGTNKPPKGTKTSSNETDQGTKNPPKVTEPKKYHNNSFRNVVVSEKAGKIIVKGQARVFEGVFQYRLKAGNETVLQDRYQTVGAPAWGDFEISINQSLADKTGATFELFVYSAKDGSEIDNLAIPLNK